MIPLLLFMSLHRICRFGRSILVAHPAQYLRRLKLSKCSISESAFSRSNWSQSSRPASTSPPQPSGRIKSKSSSKSTGLWVILIQVFDVCPSFLPGIYEKIPCDCNWRSRFLLNWQIYIPPRTYVIVVQCQQTSNTTSLVRTPSEALCHLVLTWPHIPLNFGED